MAEAPAGSLSSTCGPRLSLDGIQPVSRRLASHAENFPHRPALISDGNEVSYLDLDRQTRAAMAAFDGAGLKSGDVIAYVGSNHPRFFPILIAAMRKNVILLPINWRQKAREIAYILADSNAKIVISDEQFLEEVKKSALGDLVILASEFVDQEWLAAAPPDTKTFGDWAEPSLLLYTSGTTGNPKGVLTTERSLTIARAQEKALQGFADWRDSEKLLSPLPLFHIGGISWALCGLERGCTVVLTNDVTPASLLDACLKYDVTRTFMVPQLVRGLINEILTRDVTIDSLKAIHYGAAAMDAPLLERGLEKLGCRFLQYFGMTEMCGTISILEPMDHDLSRPELLRSVGKALPGVTLQIRDAEGHLLPCGEAGEIWVKGDTVMLGYINNEEATREAIVDGFYRTGDGGRLNENGFLFLTDRIKDMINSGGENVYPVEVEAVLREHPAVNDCAVYGVPDETWGEVVCAAVEKTPGADVTESELLNFVKSQIAGFKCPKRIDFIEALPRTASGKVQRGKIRQAAHKICN